MRAAAKALLTLLLLTSPAFAMTEADAVKGITSASGWDDMLGQLKGLVPTTVTDELKSATKDVPFPSTRVLKSQLILSQSDGKKLILRFGPNGTTFINGKPWNFLPLKTANQEIERLATYLSGGKKELTWSLPSLIPSAQAAGPISSAGLAALAYGGSNKYKSLACQGDTLDDGLTHDCPLMAVAMKEVIPANANTNDKPLPEDAKIYKPIAIRCPDKNNGVAEIISKNKYDSYSRVRVTYDSNDKPTYIAVSAGDSSRPFWDMVVIDVKTTTDPKKLAAVESIAGRVSPVAFDVCRGDDKERARFLEMLRANRIEMNFKKAENEEKPNGTTMEAK